MNRWFIEPFRKFAAAGGRRCLVKDAHCDFTHGVSDEFKTPRAVPRTPNVSAFMAMLGLPPLRLNPLLPSSVENSEGFQFSGEESSPPLNEGEVSQFQTHHRKKEKSQRSVDSTFLHFPSLSRHFPSTFRSAILNAQRQYATSAEVQKPSQESESELDGEFGNEEYAPNDAVFLAPKINSFGHSFRDYDAESARQKTVEELYRLNHINQTYDFVKRMREEYGKLDKTEMSIWECCELLNEVVDESDPDLDEPQIQHLLQSAEAIRKDYPNEDWLHLTALIHDLGKVLLLPIFGGLPQWAVVGDTYPLGCAFDKSIVHHKYFKDNIDQDNPAYNTKYGIYSHGCGLDNVVISWGHDDYMYMVAKENGTTLPSAGLFIIRYHSFYPMHQEGAYRHLMNKEDLENLKWLSVFNNYDLYSKSKVLVDVEKVKPYYQSLIRKYFPSKLKW
ncbi:inositol oxygenase 4-like isoform X1 [Cucurbita pepo subsp. pepo]|uniref:inositol oxygenase 4-like isoform X1 n=2 Tax=Cucurbita pepo subsp. pepo TaxID=3664 RepID=UPI000C9D9D68|nr:inositol oxygenase 4-like isoform X1 [Cucurbita pepo subsp. pepo]